MGNETMKPPKTIGLLINPNKNDVFDYLVKIIEYSKKSGWGVYISDKAMADRACVSGSYLSEGDFSGVVDMVISLGGDGTILRASKVFGISGKPILGINLGGLGFLTESAPQYLEDALERLSHGEFWIQERMVVSAFINNIEAGVALNDIVVSGESISRLIRIEVGINGEYLTTYTADGLIISTPTGSTAHSLSAGGPIISPDTEVVLITPICPHTLTNRPLIVNKDSIIRISLNQSKCDGLITIDGQSVYPLKREDSVTMRMASYTVKLVTFRSNSYYEILRRKLNWGGQRQS